MVKKSWFFILSILIIGMLIGTIMSLLITALLPEGVVKDFFLIKKSVGWGAPSNNWVDLGFFRFKTSRPNAHYRCCTGIDFIPLHQIYQQYSRTL